MTQTYPPNPFTDWDYSERARTGEYIVGDLLGEIGGVLFDEGDVFVQNLPPSVLIAKSTVVGPTNGLLVPWDPASADAGTKKLLGILHYPVYAGGVTCTSIPAVYMARGPQDVRSYEGRLVYPSTVAYPDMVAALAALGIKVREIAVPPFAPIL